MQSRLYRAIRVANTEPIAETCLVLYAVRDWFGAIAQDPVNKMFGSSCSQLVRDLLMDSEGDIKYKPDLWMDIRKVILPNIISEVNPCLRLLLTSTLSLSLSQALR